MIMNHEHSSEEVFVASQLSRPSVESAQGVEVPEITDPELFEIWKKVVECYPILSRVEIVAPSDLDRLQFTGGEFVLPDEEYPDPAIILVPGDEKDFEKLKRARRVAAQITADAIGVPIEALTGRMLKNAIFLHELGHAYDYLTNVASDPEIGEENAPMVWRDFFFRQMETLPVPGLSPSELKARLVLFSTLDTFIAERPQTKERLLQLGVSTVEQLLEIQERAYRALPKESFADQFAARWLNQQVQ